MALSDVALCSRALLGLGAASISSFDDGSTEAEIAQSLYGGVRDALLSSYPWNFATAESRLSRLNVTPLAGFQYAYQMPSNFLRVISAGSTLESRGMNYRIQEKRLHSDSDEVILRYLFRPPEENFPAWFDQLLISHLRAEFTIPVTDSTSRSQAMFKEAENMFAKAKTIDSQEAPSDVIESDLLISVRG